MNAKTVWKVIFALVIIAGLALGGAALYRIGFTQGAITNMTLSEGAELPLTPYRHLPYGRPIRPRLAGLMLLPLICFAGFFFMALMFGFGFMTRKRAWMHAGPGAYPPHWKHYGPPDWDPNKPPCGQEPPQKEAGLDSTETVEPEA